jgi:hypothetical protein
LCICWYVINSYYTTDVGRQKNVSSPVLGRAGQRMVCTAWCDCSRKVMVFKIIVQLGHEETDHLAADEIILPFKGRVIFIEYIPKKLRQFG